MRNALEETILVDLFPKAQIDLGIQVLQADGSVLAACINAAMLAVADAGAPFFLLCCKVLRITAMDLHHRVERSCLFITSSGPICHHHCLYRLGNLVVCQDKEHH